MFEIMVLSPQRERTSLRFNEGLTVRATESRKPGFSITPKAPVSFSQMSEPASSLLSLLKGDMSKTGNLTRYLADIINDDPAFLSWKISGRAVQFANIVIHDYIGRPKTVQQAAEMMGITTRSYRASWMQVDKFNLVKFYLDCWKDEIKRSKM